MLPSRALRRIGTLEACSESLALFLRPPTSTAIFGHQRALGACAVAIRVCRFLGGRALMRLGVVTLVFLTRALFTFIQRQARYVANLIILFLLSIRFIIVHDRSNA